MSAMKFRRSCNGCNTTFFAEDRRAIFCPKCTRKRAASPPVVVKPPRLVKAASSANATVTGFSAAAPALSAERSALSPSRAEKRSPAPRLLEKRLELHTPTTATRPRVQKTTELTPELRAKIIEVYRTLPEPITPLRKLHMHISQTVWVIPKLVSEVLSELHKSHPLRRSQLPVEQYQQLIARYQELVLRGERPAQGRRVALAQELKLPIKEVMLAIRHWASQTIGSLTRQQLFDIEKCYWQLVSQGNVRPTTLPQQIVDALGFASLLQVSRWLDQLLDGSRLTNLAGTFTVEQRDQTIALYQDYLRQSAPPAKALHTTLGKVVGLHPRQIHYILWQYRYECWQQALAQD
jgi:hypothetical protein